MPCLISMPGRTVGAFLSLCLAFACATSASAAELRQVAWLKASNMGANDHFGNGGTLEGHGVAISADGQTLAVASPYESSGARGVNGKQNDHSVYSAGAVYLFTRGHDNTAW